MNKLNKNSKKLTMELTFKEIERIHKFVQERIKNKDYGGTPIVNILFNTPDEEFEEYQEVWVCCVRDITEEIWKAKEENRKAEILSVFKEVTDTDKADFI